MEKRVQFVQDLNRTFKTIQNNFTDQVQRVIVENGHHRDKISKMIAEMTNSNETLCAETNTVAQKLILRSDKLQQLIDGYTTDRRKLAISISDCLAASQQLSLTTEEVLRVGNNEVRRETEMKMCNFTDNMLKEFRYIN